MLFLLFQVEKLKLHFERELLKQPAMFPTPAPQVLPCNCRNDRESKNLDSVLTSLSQTNQTLQKRNEELTNQLLMFLIQTNNNIKLVDEEEPKQTQTRKGTSTMCCIM